MLNLTPEHEDERRKLFSFPEAKVLEVKEDCVLGEHYHKLKTELFILIKGSCNLYRSNNNNETGFWVSMKRGIIYKIVPNTYHMFKIQKGSILIGLNSKPFDATDDYKL